MKNVINFSNFGFQDRRRKEIERLDREAMRKQNEALGTVDPAEARRLIFQAEALNNKALDLREENLLINARQDRKRRAEIDAES